MTRFSLATLAFAALLVGGNPAPAQTTNEQPGVPAGTPAATATPFPGFSGTGSLNVQGVAQGTQVSLAAQVSVWSKARRVRLDLLHLDITGTDPNAGAMVAQMLPKGALTLVYDQRSNTTTIWNEQKRVYFQMKSATAKTPAPKETPNPADTTSQVLTAMKSLTQYDTFTESLALLGHQPVNGHASSVFHLSIQSQQHGKKPQDISGDLAFADDLSGIPLRFWLSVKGEVEGSVKLDILSAEISAPKDSVFAVPAGFKKVTSILELLGNSK